MVYIIQSPCVGITLKFDNVIFDILKHGTVYNILQIKNNGVYIYLCWVVVRKTTEHSFLCGYHHTTMRSDSGDIYCGTLFDNIKKFQ